MPVPQKNILSKIAKVVVMWLAAFALIPAASAQNPALRALLAERHSSDGPRGVLNDAFDAWIRANTLHVRSAKLPLTTPYQEITLEQNARQISADSDYLYVWIAADRLLRFTLDGENRVNVPDSIAIDDTAAAQALERRRLRPSLPATSKTPDAERPGDAVVVNPPLLFVTNSGGNVANKIAGDSVTVINTITNTTTGNMLLTAGNGPIQVAITPDNSKGYIVNGMVDCFTCQGRGVTPFNPATQQTAGPTLGAAFPFAAAVSNDGTRVAVGDFLSLKIYDPSGTQVATSSVPVPIQGLAISPDNKNVYALLSGTLQANGTTLDSVYVASVATAQVSVQIPLPTNSGCTSMAASADGTRIYVGCYVTPAIFAFQYSGGFLSQLQTVPSHGVGGLAVSADGKTLYVAYSDIDALDVLNTSSLTRKSLINTDFSPLGVAVSADGTRAYVANYGANDVSVLDLTNNNSVATIPVGPQPWGVALTTPPPTIGVTPTQITFTASAGQSNPPSQNVALTVAQFGPVTSTFTWTATTTTKTGGSWLTTTAASGNFPATLGIGANTSGLAPGTYTGTVSIASANTGNTPLTINVSLTVNPSGVLAVDQPQVAFQIVAGSPSPTPSTVNVTNTGPGGAISWSAVVSPSSSWLTLTPASGATPTPITVGVNTQGLPAGQLSATVTISSAGALKPITFTVGLTILPGPTIPSAGIVNAASFTASLGAAPGSLISLFGSNMGPAAGVGASTVPLPTALANTQVTIGGFSAPLFYVSASQINCQVPWEVAGQTSVQVVVQTGTAVSPPATLTIAAASPGIFTGVINGASVGAILNQDYSQNTPANPAHVGQVIQIFANGQGVVANQPGDGAAAPSGPLATTASNPAVLIGGQPAAVGFSGLSPGFVGLWQVNATIPATVTPGTAVSVQIIVGTAISNAATVSIVAP